MFERTEIEGVFFAELSIFKDSRGWLSELWRTDWLDGMGGPVPAMCYISMTEAGVARGPHEHESQTDYFAFIGPGDFKLKLWDAREKSPSLGKTIELTLGTCRPGVVIVPPGVVHGYRCISAHQGMVLNLADRLYRGQGKEEPVDEIRHEEADGSPYRMD